jgi:hypothetical protein
VGRCTQNTWVAEVLAAHANGEQAAKVISEEAKSDAADGEGFEVVARATREVLEKLENLFEAVGEMEDDETAREVAHRVAEGVSAASMETFVTTRVQAAAATATARRESTWLTQAFNERGKKASKKTTRVSSKKGNKPTSMAAKLKKSKK